MKQRCASASKKDKEFVVTGHSLNKSLRKRIAALDPQTPVVLPAKAVQNLIEQMENAEDLRAYRAAANDPYPLMDGAVVRRIIVDKVNPVRAIREHMNLAQGTLAIQSGISQSYLSEIESGRKPPSAAAAKALAEVLGVAVDDII